jgi:hypothetical protein
MLALLGEMISVSWLQDEAPSRDLSQHLERCSKQYSTASLRAIWLRRYLRRGATRDSEAIHQALRNPPRCAPCHLLHAWSWCSFDLWMFGNYLLFRDLANSQTL